MPELKNKKKPVEIEFAICAIERYQDSCSDASDEAYIQWLRKNLPALSMSIARSGEAVDTDFLLRNVQKGQEHIEGLLAEMKSKRVSNKNTAPSYDDIVKAFPMIDERTELDRGAPVNDPGDLPLREAILNGHIDVVQQLLDNGNSVHLSYEEGHYLLSISPDADITLAFAAGNGCSDVVQMLLDKGADTHDNFDHALFLAARNGHIEVVRLLLDKGLDLNKAMSESTRKGHIDIVKLFLDSGVDVNKNGGSALINAAQEGRIDVVQLLIDSGADVNENNCNALVKAASRGHVDVVQLLLDSGADVNKNIVSALCYAAGGGHIDTVQLFLDRGLYANKGERIALFDAARGGHVDVVRLLLDSGMDIHANDDNALRIAAAGGHSDVIRLLLDSGADIHAKDDDALLLATRSDVMQLLIDSGFDVNSNNGSALHTCASYGLIEKVQLLLDNGADIHAKDDTALLNAAKDGHSDVVRLLLDNGANIHAKNDTALLNAAKEGHIDVVRLLLDNGANIYAGDDAALRFIAGGGHIDLVQLLLDSGANIHDAALRFAAEGGRSDVVQLLLDNGADIHAGDDAALRLAIDNNEYEMVWLLVDEDVDLEKKYLSQDIEYAKCKVWKRLHNEFKIQNTLIDKNPYDFKLKTYLSVMDMLSKEGYKGPVCAEYAYNISTLFRTEDRVLRYLQKWGTAGTQPLHDCAQHIKVPQAGNIDYQAWGDAILQQGPNMAIFVKFAGRLAQPTKTHDGKNWSLKGTRRQCAHFHYNEAPLYPELAELCFRFNWDEDEFDSAISQVNRYKKLFAASDMKKTKSRLPDIRMDGAAFGKPDYHFYKLPDGDLRGLLLGEFTNCCQHLANAGEGCAKHGFLSEQGGFYVVADKKTDDIIGQSWAWRGKRGELVFDSLESLQGHFSANNWEDIANEFAAQIKQDNRAKISTMHIGAGGATPSLSFNQAALAKPSDFPSKGYRDSQDKQYLVSDFKLA